MNGAGIKLSKTACCLLSVICAGSALAAPPPSRGDLLERASNVSSLTSNSITSKLSRAAAERPEFSHLDLRPPTSVPGFRNAASEDAAFPSVRRAPSSDTSGEEDRFGALRNTAAQVHVMSRAQEIAHRVRTEGLPVARLWENHSALVSLGLNQRGKPGLWLMQKIP